MTLNSTNIIIADLESKFEQIKKNDSDKIFYTKMADYGKYLLDHEETRVVLTPLYEEAKADITNYIEMAKLFLDRWNSLAQDLVNTAEREGMQDDLNDPYKMSISQIKSRLGQFRVSGYSYNIDDY